MTSNKLVQNMLKSSTTEELKLILQETARELSLRTNKHPSSIIKEWDNEKRNRNVKYKTVVTSNYNYSIIITITENYKKEIFSVNSEKHILKNETKRLVSIEALNNCSFFKKYQNFDCNLKLHEINDIISNDIKLNKIQNETDVVTELTECIYFFEYLTHPICCEFFAEKRKLYKIFLLKMEELKSEFKKDEIRHLQNRFDIAYFKIRDFERRFV